MGIFKAHHGNGILVRGGMALLLAGIDIGTLTCRMLIAEVTADFSLKETESDRRILRLGEGVDEKQSLSAAAMTRVVKTLCEWRKRIQAYPIAGTAVVATSAVRDASNREEFLSHVQRDAGLEVEILNGNEEARRTLLGIQSGLPLGVERFLGVDIGGGSTEFMRVHKNLSPQQVEVFSLDVGVVRLTEREFYTDAPPSNQALLAAEELIQGELETIRGWLGDVSGMTCVGTAGTITTLAAMAQELSNYDSARIHNYRLSLEKIQQLERELRRRTLSERRELPGLEQGREDVIVAGNGHTPNGDAKTRIPGVFGQ